MFKFEENFFNICLLDNYEDDEEIKNDKVLFF